MPQVMTMSTHHVTPPMQRRRRQPITLEQMREPNGTPVRVSDLSEITGLSKDKIADDIHSGHLKAAPSRRAGAQFVFLITFVEAKRYLRALGLL